MFGILTLRAINWYIYAAPVYIWVESGRNGGGVVPRRSLRFLGDSAVYFLGHFHEI